MKATLSILFSLVVVIAMLTVSKVSGQTEGNSKNKTGVSRELTKAQLASIKAIKKTAAIKSAPIALYLAATVKRIYENMLRDKEDVRLRKRLSLEMNNTTLELFVITGQSIRDVVRVLTPAQRELLKIELRKHDAGGNLMEIIDRTFAIPN